MVASPSLIRLDAAEGLSHIGGASIGGEHLASIGGALGLLKPERLRSDAMTIRCDSGDLALGRFAQAPDAAPAHGPGGPALLDRCTQRAHGRGGAQHVFSGQKAENFGLAHRQRAEHERAVGNGLVAGHGNGARERFCLGGDGFQGRRFAVHGGPVLTIRLR